VLLAAGAPETLEAVAGCIEPGEDGMDCVCREAMEEAGLRLDALQPIAVAWSMPGVSTERLHLFLGQYRESDLIGPGGGLAAEHEGVTRVEIELSKLAAMADSGEINDMKTFALVQTLRLRRPDLFDS
jgi:nudix-type nucleoside diphosphatase (YffH/AdpP family)